MWARRAVSVRGGAFGARFASVAIVGGGPAGYVCAIKAAQLGLETTCIEKRKTLGGTCLNVGCIPSKALLNVSHKFEEIKHLKKYGITVGGSNEPDLDFGKMMKYKEKTVFGLTKGIEGLFKKNKVKHVLGEATLTGPNTLEVDGQTITADHIILATGSEPIVLPHLPVDDEGDKVFVSSTGALDLPEVPKKMVIIGAGVIGLELGCVYMRLGAEVEVIELLDRICPAMDLETATMFQKVLTKQGMKFTLGAKVTGASKSGGGASLEVELKDGEKVTMAADRVLVGIGRKPVKIPGLEAHGVQFDRRGCVEINDKFESSVPSVLAIGDCVRGAMLAHKGEEEGVKVAELLAAKHGLITATPHTGHLNYDAIPSVVYTHPEIASVGKSEEELKEAGIPYKKGKFMFMANSRARCNDDADGFVKVLADPETGKLLGAHILGPEAGDLIHPLTVGMEYGASAQDMGETTFAHPTLSEAVKEACMAAYGKPIHM